MCAFPLQRPLLPSHYRVLLDPPDDKGDEALTFVSIARRVKLRGHAFREFRKLVLPLLDGRHEVAQIAAACSEEFEPEDLDEALTLLHAQGLLREAAQEPSIPEDGTRLPQWNQWHDLGFEPAEVQARLAAATVAIVGIAGAGAVAAQALAAAGVGTLQLVDNEPVHTADGYLASAYAGDIRGRVRADVLRDDLLHHWPDLRVQAQSGNLSDDDAVAEAVRGSNVVLCCLDDGRSGLAYKLNRVCLRLQMPWLAAGSAGTEVWVGPLMRPPSTACYLCFRMRLVAAAENPEDAYALSSHLDRLRRDDSSTHESLVYGEGIAGQLAALETTKALVGVPAPAASGQLVVFDLISLAATRHKVLRKPWCPACGSLPWAKG
jgi:molybdopterin-synthase adenylyltransferase